MEFWISCGGFSYQSSVLSYETICIPFNWIVPLYLFFFFSNSKLRLGVGEDTKYTSFLVQIFKTDTQDRLDG